MSYLIPSDTHGAGDTGHISDHNNIADVLTANSNAWLPTYQAPSGATAETFPWPLIGGSTSALTSGTLYVMSLALRQNTVVNNLTFCTKGTAETGGTHAWYVLLDSGLVVRAVTADQTSATALTSLNTPYTFATNSYTTTYSGRYYVGVCVVATGMPLLAVSSGGGTLPQALINGSVILCGSSSTGQTTPPAVGTTMGALTASNGFSMYAYTS